MKKKKVILGMSGGTDSAVSAYLLKMKGYEVTGITFSLWDDASRCCNIEDIMDAKETAAKTGIAHYTVNLKKEFREKVVDDFIDTYLEAKTPNPCAVCNEKVKMAGLYKKMLELGYDYIATGHYAKISKTKSGIRLLPAIDTEKSQEYFLARVKPEVLSRCIFPLGGMKKPEVKMLAKKLGLVREKPESQEACFLKHNESPSDFIKRMGRGNIDKGAVLIGPDGKQMAKLPEPYYRYTIGQRKGLGVGGGSGIDGPVFVTRVSAENKVYAGTKDRAYAKILTAHELNMLYNLKGKVLKAKVKIRYRSTPNDAVITLKEGTAEIEFNEPQFAVTPGQVAAVYIKNALVMSGIIE